MMNGRLIIKKYLDVLRCTWTHAGELNSGGGFINFRSLSTGTFWSGCLRPEHAPLFTMLLFSRCHQTKRDLCQSHSSPTVSASFLICTYFWIVAWFEDLGEVIWILFPGTIDYATGFYGRVFQFLIFIDCMFFSVWGSQGFNKVFLTMGLKISTMKIFIRLDCDLLNPQARVRIATLYQTAFSTSVRIIAHIDAMQYGLAACGQNIQKLKGRNQSCWVNWKLWLIRWGLWAGDCQSKRNWIRNEINSNLGFLCLTKMIEKWISVQWGIKDVISSLIEMKSWNIESNWEFWIILIHKCQNKHSVLTCKLGMQCWIYSQRKSGFWQNPVIHWEDVVLQLLRLNAILLPFHIMPLCLPGLEMNRFF